MAHTDEAASFDFEAFGQALGYRPWPYSPNGTYWDGGSRFLDWQKGPRLLGLAHSELLLSEADPTQGGTRLHPFPMPKTVGDAVEAVVVVGWVADTAVARGAVLQAYARLG